MSGSKIHKRGDRGSTEENPNTCKLANMAATEDTMDQEPTTKDPTITATEITATETSLEELKEMLVDIQINIAYIFRERKTYGMSGRSLQLPFGNRSMKSPTLKPR